MFDFLMHHRIQSWLELAAEELQSALNRDLIVEEKKSASDLVTEMDKQTEKFLVDKIRTYYPEHKIIGEEGIVDEEVTDVSGMVWIIDPIDGTLNFVKQKNNFGIMIGLFYDGQPVAGYIYDVMAGYLYTGIVGEGAFINNKPIQLKQYQSIDQSLVMGNVGMFVNNIHNTQAVYKKALGARAYGSAALEVISVIRGEASIYISHALSPWDFAAGYAICSSLGMKVTTLENKPINILKRSSVIFAHKDVHQEAINLLNPTE
ncbi:inositol monophosphatase family protein [Fundicoccus culcitae]|uniref:Inositol monophosphatase family protein n=1 Tax=Fundicoccus culcitae TaxID=2969821 RepID=A0ABY5P6B1_9LACT|nr:inositol monophosphatase family protein [Fundicoccus culcitae]UUX34283.1 inositol monophosphatase family protein [Fundicoccus culcitae]